MTDIDVDFYDRDRILQLLDHRVAKLENGQKHNTGVYFTEIPHNPLDRVSTIDYRQAAQRGYFKIDFLNVHIYKDIVNEEHLKQLIDREPMWELLEHQEFVDQLFHLSGYHEICKKLKPNTVEKLAAVLSIIRPAKRHLQNSSWDEILEQVWIPPEDGSYYFKRSHSISYSIAVVVHMNLLCDQLTLSV
jgi:hypothetical protein